MKNKNFGILIIIGIMVFISVLVGVTVTSNMGKSQKEITYEQATENLNKIISNVNIIETQPKKANVILENNPQDELPSINKYPLSVTGTGDINIEIFATAEKAGNNKDGWLNEVAKKFNEQNNKVDEKSISVSIRPIASGLGTDYIVSGKYHPTAFSPSNELWGEMIISSGVKAELVEKRLIGNVAGILLSKTKTQELTNKYGEINLKTIIEATSNNEIAMGYTNPFASATGLNFLVSTLESYDSENPFSEVALSGFERFQTNVPFVSYTTLQMRDAAESGVLDGFIMEYQTYSNDTDLRKYVFTPFGDRHDNPVYSIGTLTKEEKEVLNLFIKYSKSEESQKLATKYGFNQLDSYKSESNNLDGDSLFEAQDIYKEKKDSGKPVTAVFVADISGSMNGEPINNLKKSLVNASQYINSDNYIGLVSYNSDVYVDLPIAKFDLNQRAYFTGAVQALDAVGGTASYDAISVALKMLLEAKENNPQTKLIMFLLSDGEVNTGVSLRKVTGIIDAFDIPVYTIGYNAELSDLETLSKINEAASINADSDDVVYKLKNLFNSEM